MNAKQKEEVIDRHKKQGIAIYTITCESGEECIIKHPDVEVTNKVLIYLFGAPENRNMLKAGKIILEECWMAGDDLIRTDKELNGEAAFGASTMVELKVAEVKKN